MAKAQETTRQTKMEEKTKTICRMNWVCACGRTDTKFAMSKNVDDYEVQLQERGWDFDMVNGESEWYCPLCVADKKAEDEEAERNALEEEKTDRYNLAQHIFETGAALMRAGAKVR